MLSIYQQKVVTGRTNIKQLLNSQKHTLSSFGSLLHYIMCFYSFFYIIILYIRLQHIILVYSVWSVAYELHVQVISLLGRCRRILANPTEEVEFCSPFKVSLFVQNTRPDFNIIMIFFMFILISYYFSAGLNTCLAN